ncbi:hypothetical protein RHGRI_031552 [Rhododendron griersonianum]|uniref:Uncharacterized protein n=1 Tax=Rhododendron griersonianum TaxID=479676 RepID=A0AAV6ICZ0_9ERIC|nr:hypothetical protein RHGRI_031552 [Rhododendron griersonianum]
MEFSAIPTVLLTSSSKAPPPVQVKQRRPESVFHPSVWGDHFLAYASADMRVDINTKQKHQQLKEDVRKQLVEAKDVFNKFKDNEGKFKESLIGDVRGLLSLYQATFLSVRQEDILDEAMKFTTTHLNSALPNLSNNPIAAQVVHALYQPIHKGLTRLESRLFISFYQKDDSHNKVLLDFVTLDFNLLQKLHQKELSELTRWWKALDVAGKLPFARDRLVEIYFWLKDLVGAYCKEAKWYHEGYVPSMDEHWPVALLSCGHQSISTISFIGMGELATKEAFDWVSSNPLIVQGSSVICRLIDDVVGHKFEQERGHIASSVECYMKQYGATEEEAIVEFQKRVTNAWKDMNSEFLRPTPVPMPLLQLPLNLARVIYVLYKDGDNYTHSGTKLKGIVTSVLVDPVPT